MEKVSSVHFAGITDLIKQMGGMSKSNTCESLPNPEAWLLTLN